MKRIAQHFYLASVLLGLAVVLISLSVQAQADQDSVSDRPSVSSEPFIFTEIELTPEGVIAYDTSGHRWNYDFRLDQFVEGDQDQEESGDGRESGDREERADPVEVRCIERKSVAFPALRAVYVGRDEYVDGDILAYGRVTVKGWVKGDVESFNKTVLVTSTGQVDGDIKAPDVIIKPGGVVLGAVIESAGYNHTIPDFDTEGIWVVFAFTLVLTLIVFLTSSLAARQTTNMTDCVCQYPARSFLFGFLFLMLAPAIMILVAVTVVGVLIVPIAYLVSLALGMGVTGFQIARPLARRHLGMNLGPVVTSLVGVGMHMSAWAIVALILGSDHDGSFGYYGLGVFLLVISILGTSYSFLTGIGAAVLTRFGFRPYVGRAEAQTPSTEAPPAPAPPPIPTGPGPTHKPSTPFPRPSAPPKPPLDDRQDPAPD